MNEEQELYEDWETVITNLPDVLFLKFCTWYISQIGFSNVSLTIGNSDSVSGFASISLGVIVQWFEFYFFRENATFKKETIQQIRKRLHKQTDKAMIFTTGNFDREVKREARAKGEIPIDLVDGSNWSKRLSKSPINGLTKQLNSLNLKIKKIESFLL